MDLANALSTLKQHRALIKHLQTEIKHTGVPSKDQQQKLDSLQLLERSYIQQLFKVYEEKFSFDQIIVEQTILLEQIERLCTEVVTLDLR